MLKDNHQLQALKNTLTVENPVVTGLVKGTSKVFGFLQLEDGESFFIAPNHMSRLRHGDTVEGHVETNGDKTNFVPAKLVQESEAIFVGRVKVNDKVCMITPDHPLDNVSHFLPLSQAKGFEIGDWVKVKMVKHPFYGKSRLELVKLVAKHDDVRAPWEYAVALHNIPSDHIPKPGNGSFDINSVLGKRRDLRNKPIFTIDSFSTMDMDDGLMIACNPEGNLVVTVAISDPTEIIKSGSFDDSVAKQRGFTVYLPSRSIPMISRDYSENEFSLKESEDRLSLCVDITYDKDGKESSYEFYEAVISSKAKLVYNEVSDALEAQFSNVDCAYSDEIKSQLSLFEDYFKLRSNWRSENAVLFKDQPDIDFYIENWAVTGIVKQNRRVANKIVEEAMISANIVCADFLSKNAKKAIYNSHAGFDVELINEAAEITSIVDARFTADYISTIEGYCDLRKTMDSGEFEYEDLLLRKFQSRTEFVTSPAPHKGLGFDKYATWTSPIRKYNDMVNHRIIKSILRGEEPFDEIDDLLIESMNASLFRQRKAERTVKSWLHNIYLANFIGKEMTGRIVFVNKGGFILELDETGNSVFVSKMFLGTRSNPAEINEEKGFIEYGGKRIKLADKFSLKIKSIDIDKQRLDYEI